MTPVPPWIGELERRASDDPDEIAIAVEGGDDLAFGSWHQRSSALAASLAERAVAPGVRVALRFDARHWADFAVARLGVLKAGAVAVLVPAGLGHADAARIVRHSGAAGVLCPPHLGIPGSEVWSADPGALASGAGPSPGGGLPGDPAAVTELVYPRLPLARPRPVARTGAQLVALVAVAAPGCLVHAWAPGSAAGQLVLALVLGGRGTRAASLARFSPAGFAQLVTRLQADGCGLPEALALALATAGAAPFGGVSSVLLSRRAGHRSPVDLAPVFPRAAVAEVDEDGVDGPVGGGATTAASPPGRLPMPAPDPGPIGPSQVGMLWHEQLAPGSFNLPSLVRRYRGALDVAALERALAELTRRHEPLRTTFALEGGRAVQHVGPPLAGLPVTDLSGMAPAEREVETARLVGEATGRPFDLVDGPLFAPHLVRLGDEDHVLVVRLHHTAFDDWSVDVFRRDLSALYAAALPGAAAPAAGDPPPRFVDVCRRQQARLEGDGGSAQRAHWRAQLAGAPLAARLALGEPHQLGPDRPGAGEPLRRYLPTILVRDLRALAPRLRATPFMTVLAAFELLLARRSGLDDLVFATVVAGRGSTANERMIGCFTKKVLLRVQLGDDPTFPELVARTRTSVLGALTNQDLPFEAVVQDTLGPAAAAHGLAAQVPVVFQGETPQRFRLAMPGVEVAPFEMPPSTRRERHFTTQGGEESRQARRWGEGVLSETFLLLSLLELEDGMALVARGVFHRPAASRLLQDLEALLTDIARSPDRRVSELGILPAAPPGPDEIDLLGLRLQRSPIEKALASCPGVAEASVEVDRSGQDRGPRMVASIATNGQDRAPTLAALRAGLWAALPGSPWPAAAVVVDAVASVADGRLDTSALQAAPPAVDERPDPDAALLSTLWAEAGGAPASPAASYWQDFTFLQALADARAAGLPITDEQVSRCRTPEMLAAALAAAPPP